MLLEIRREVTLGRGEVGRESPGELEKGFSLIWVLVTHLFSFKLSACDMFTFLHVDHTSVKC